MAQSPHNIAVHPSIRTIMNRQKRKVIDIAKAFDLGYTRTYELLKNPNKLSVERIYILSGYFGIDCVTLFATIHYNKPKLSIELNNTLADILKKVEDINK